MKLLLTGAAGRVATLIRPRLRAAGVDLILSDRAPIADLEPGEKDHPCDLADGAAVDAMVATARPDGIFHLGGQATETAFETVLDANIRGTYHLFEAARCHGQPRILYASSYHVAGFHDVGTRLDASAEMRPDSLYGLSKCYGELLARLYRDKFGVESVSLRIGSCFEVPRHARMLSTWFSPADCARLVLAVFAAGPIGAEVIYGQSDNARGWWSNAHATWLDWVPQDSADAYADQVADEIVEGPQGGPFADPARHAERFRIG